MFNNPLRKYASGGAAPSEQQKQKVLQIFENAAKNAGIDINLLASKADELANNPEELNIYSQELQLASDGKPEGIAALQKRFSNKNMQFAKLGGKLHDFICKHAKGGAIMADCGCKVPKGFRGLSDIGDNDGYNTKTLSNGRTWEGLDGMSRIINDQDTLVSYPNANNETVMINSKAPNRAIIMGPNGWRNIFSGIAQWRRVNSYFDDAKIQAELEKKRNNAQSVPTEENGGIIKGFQGLSGIGDGGEYQMKTLPNGRTLETYQNHSRMIIPREGAQADTVYTYTNTKGEPITFNSRNPQVGTLFTKDGQQEYKVGLNHWPSINNTMDEAKMQAELANKRLQLPPVEEAKGGVVKNQEPAGPMPEYKMVQDTSFINAAKEPIRQIVIVDNNGQGYRKTFGLNNAAGGYWDGKKFNLEGDDSIPVAKFDSLLTASKKPQQKVNVSTSKKANGGKTPNWINKKKNK